MKTEFTQSEVAKLYFAHQSLYGSISTIEPKIIDEEGRYWHITDVNLSHVVGTVGRRYSGTWLDLYPSIDDLAGLKRGKANANELKSTPHYYFSEEEKEHWEFCNIDGELYINIGHHRTVIGRVFLEANGFAPIIKNVHVSYYTGGLKHRIRAFPRRLKKWISDYYNRNYKFRSKL